LQDFSTISCEQFTAGKILTPAKINTTRFGKFFAAPTFAFIPDMGSGRHRGGGAEMRKGNQ